MIFNSINPFNNEVIGTYTSLTDSELQSKLDQSAHAFENWKNISLIKRIELLKKLSAILIERMKDCAEMITLEMGKPIAESYAEIKKCAWVCDYYAENAESFLADELIATDAQRSFVRHEPLGPVLAIMPWNFPFWQVFRFAAPSLTAGNTALLKHASNVFGCAELIVDIFIQAGYPQGVFQNLLIHHDKCEEIIANHAVQAVTLTGSERAGSAVAAIAGKQIKKCVLELGGSNAFIVAQDADLELAVKTALSARMLNTGQSCIAAKRFIIVDEVYDEFVRKFISFVKELTQGDPLDERTNIGPLARVDLAENLNRQIAVSTKMGADLLLGGGQKSCLHEPTILGGVAPGMPAFDEETFGPLACMVKAKNLDEAFQFAKKTRYGLGLSIFTSNINEALRRSSSVPDGAYFINEMVKSDPRLPFGGTNKSGYGRELAKDGILEFVNRKTIYVK